MIMSEEILTQTTRKHIFKLTPKEKDIRKYDAFVPSINKAMIIFFFLTKK